MKMLKISGMATAVAVVLSVAAPVAPARAAELWQGYTYYPNPKSPEYEAMERFADRVAKETKNALRIRNTPGGGMPIKGNDIQQAVADDVIQFGEVTGGVVSMLPIYGLSRLPGLFGSEAEFRKASRLLEPYYRKDLDSKGVTMLGLFFYPQQTVFSADANLKRLADLKGAKVRVTTPQQSFVLEKLGAVPVTLATPEVAPGLQQGVVSAVLTATAGGGRLWVDMLKVNYRIVINWSSGLLLANKKRMDGLDAATKKIVARIGEEEAQNVTKGLLGTEDDLTKGFAKDGKLKVVEANPEDEKMLAQMSAGYWDEEAKKIGPDAVKALAEIRKALNK